jgi:hypothetical protein
VVGPVMVNRRDKAVGVVVVVVLHLFDVLPLQLVSSLSSLLSIHQHNNRSD